MAGDTITSGDIGEKVNEPIPITADEIFNWVDTIKKTKSEKDWWGAKAVVDRNAPGADKADRGLAIREGGQIMAVSLLAPGHLIGVFVLPDYADRGYGGLLIKRSIELLLSIGKGEKIKIEVCDRRAERIINRLPENLKQYLQIIDVMKDE
ncbi:MAG TPA: GNAT family N-acetyltransferase [Patescibacteria group bacterium]|nr:GNAT family N-acetyltransferase [Patescibacteria group bacterium]